jgi:hypothetical protein
MERVIATWSTIMLTLPTIARDHDLSIDTLRRGVREIPALRDLGQRVGGVRAYTPEEGEKIVAAIRERQQARKAKASV